MSYIILPISENEPALLLNNVYWRLSGKYALENISIRVNSGEIVGLIGPNGAGKSTLFSLICGIRKPISGEIFLAGRDVTKLPMHYRARMGMGYLPQDSSIFEDLTVEENIIVMLEMAGYTSKNKGIKLQEILNDFNLTDRKDTLGSSLSGGERRRTEIARSLILQPKLLLFDEPFAGVDPLATNELKKTARALRKKGMGILITDHNVHDCLTLVDRVYVISNGCIIASGTPLEITKNKVAKKQYLGNDFHLS